LFGGPARLGAAFTFRGWGPRFFTDQGFFSGRGGGRVFRGGESWGGEKRGGPQKGDFPRGNGGTPGFGETFRLKKSFFACGPTGAAPPKIFAWPHPKGGGGPKREKGGERGGKKKKSGGQKAHPPRRFGWPPRFVWGLGHQILVGGTHRGGAFSRLGQGPANWAPPRRKRPKGRLAQPGPKPPPFHREKVLRFFFFPHPGAPPPRATEVLGSKLSTLWSPNNNPEEPTHGGGPSKPREFVFYWISVSGAIAEGKKKVLGGGGPAFGLDHPGHPEEGGGLGPFGLDFGGSGPKPLC